MKRREAACNLCLSVIIPTWNEEAWLPTLLEALGHCPEVHELIVADNHSTDRTVELARKAECIVVDGGTPAAGRNAGARVATGDILLFVDADAVVTSRHVRRVLEVLGRLSTIGVLFPVVPMTNDRFTRLCYKIMDIYVRILGVVGIRQGIGALIGVRAEKFRELGGFREVVSVGEDADFIRRLGDQGFIAYDRSMAVLVSARRFAIETPVVFALKCVFWAALRLARLRASGVPYSWCRYPISLADRDRMYLDTVVGGPYGIS